VVPETISGRIKLIGVDCGAVRLPLRALTERDEASLREGAPGRSGRTPRPDRITGIPLPPKKKGGRTRAAAPKPNKAGVGQNFKRIPDWTCHREAAVSFATVGRPSAVT